MPSTRYPICPVPAPVHAGAMVPPFRLPAVFSLCLARRTGPFGIHSILCRTGRSAHRRPVPAPQGRPGRDGSVAAPGHRVARLVRRGRDRPSRLERGGRGRRVRMRRSEEHTSELQSRRDLVCRLLLEKKKKKLNQQIILIKKKKKENK